MFDQLGQGWSDLTGWISNELDQLGASTVDPARQWLEQLQNTQVGGDQVAPVGLNELAAGQPQTYHATGYSDPPVDLGEMTLQDPPAQAPSWPVVGGALEAGMNLMDLANRPINAVMAGAIEQRNQIQNAWNQGDIGGALANITGASLGNPNVRQAMEEAWTGKRQVDPTELPGIEALPNQTVLGLGPTVPADEERGIPAHPLIDINPRTAAGFFTAMAGDPVNLATMGLGEFAAAARPALRAGQQAAALDRALEGASAAAPAWARALGPAHTAAEAAQVALGPVQGAALTGRDPVTGEWDPGRTAAGAVGGLAFAGAPWVLPPAAHALSQAGPLPRAQRGEAQVDFASFGLNNLLQRALRMREGGARLDEVRSDIETNVRGTPPEVVDEVMGRVTDQYPETAPFTPEMFGGKVKGIFEGTPEENRIEAKKEMTAAGATGLFDQGDAQAPRQWQVGDDARVSVPGRISQRWAKIVNATPDGAFVRTEDGEEHVVRWSDVFSPGGEEERVPPTLAAQTGRDAFEGNVRSIEDAFATAVRRIEEGLGYEDGAQDLAETRDRWRETGGDAAWTGIVKGFAGKGSEAGGLSWDSEGMRVGDHQFSWDQIAQEVGSHLDERRPQEPVTPPEPARPIFPLPSGNFGAIQDEGQLTARIQEIGRMPATRPGHIRLDVSPDELDPAGRNPRPQLQAQLDAVQRAAEKVGFQMKSPRIEQGRNGQRAVFLDFEQIVNPPEPGPMTTPPERRPGETQYQPPTPPARQGQEAEVVGRYINTKPPAAGQRPIVQEWGVQKLADGWWPVYRVRQGDIVGDWKRGGPPTMPDRAFKTSLHARAALEKSLKAGLQRGYAYRPGEVQPHELGAAEAAPAKPKLTQGQQRILDEVNRDGERIYNGRARKTIEALEKAGLVDVEWDMRPQVKGNGMELTEKITVRRKGEAPAAPAEAPPAADRFAPNEHDYRIAEHGDQSIPLEERARRMAIYRAEHDAAPTVGELGVKPGDQVWVNLNNRGWQQSRVMGDLNTGRIFEPGVEEGKSLPVRWNLSDSPIRHYSTADVRLSPDEPSFGERWREENRADIERTPPAEEAPTPAAEDEGGLPPDTPAMRAEATRWLKETADRAKTLPDSDPRFQAVVDWASDEGSFQGHAERVRRLAERAESEGWNAKQWADALKQELGLGHGSTLPGNFNLRYLPGEGFTVGNTHEAEGPFAAARFPVARVAKAVRERLRQERESAARFQNVPDDQLQARYDTLAADRSDAAFEESEAIRVEMDRRGIEFRPPDVYPIVSDTDRQFASPDELAQRLREMADNRPSVMRMNVAPDDRIQETGNYNVRGRAAQQLREIERISGELELKGLYVSVDPLRRGGRSIQIGFEGEKKKATTPPAPRKKSEPKKPPTRYAGGNDVNDRIEVQRAREDLERMEAVLPEIEELGILRPLVPQISSVTGQPYLVVDPRYRTTYNNGVDLFSDKTAVFRAKFGREPESPLELAKWQIDLQREKLARLEAKLPTEPLPVDPKLQKIVDKRHKALADFDAAAAKNDPAGAIKAIKSVRQVTLAAPDAWTERTWVQERESLQAFVDNARIDAGLDKLPPSTFQAPSGAAPDQPRAPYVAPDYPVRDSADGAFEYWIRAPEDPNPTSSKTKATSNWTIETRDTDGNVNVVGRMLPDEETARRVADFLAQRATKESGTAHINYKNQGKQLEAEIAQLRAGQQEIGEPPPPPDNPFALVREPGIGRTPLSADEAAEHMEQLEQRYTLNNERIRELEGHLQGDVYRPSGGELTNRPKRPPWAVGWTDDALIALAQRHDLNPFDEEWWVRGNFTPGTGEMREDVGQSGLRGTGRLRGTAADARSELAQLQSEQEQILAAVNEIDGFGGEGFYRHEYVTPEVPWQDYTLPREPERATPAEPAGAHPPGSAAGEGVAPAGAGAQEPADRGAVVGPGRPGVEEPVAEPGPESQVAAAGQPGVDETAPPDGEITSEPEPAQAAGAAPPPSEPLEPPSAEEPPGPLKKPIITARRERTRHAFLEPDELAHVTALRDQVDPLTGLPLVSPQQVVGISKGLVAMNGRAQPDTYGFLLLDGMGIGKTRQMLAIAQYYADRGHPVVIVTPDRVLGSSDAYWKNRDLWSGSFRDDGRALGLLDRMSLLQGGETMQPGQIHLTTYTQLKNSRPGDFAFKLPTGDVFTQKPIFMFDETQQLKTPTSRTAQAGQLLMQQAHAVLFASATPFDQPGHFAYLERAGVFEPDLFATPHDAMLDLGMRPSGTGYTASGNELVFNARLEQKMQRLTDKGLMVRREFSYDNVPVGPRDMDVPQSALDDMATINAAYQGRGRMAEQEGLQAERAVLEPHKVPVAVRLAQEALADGNRQVVIFTSGLNPREVTVKHYAKDPLTGKVERHPTKTKWYDPRTGEYLTREANAPVISYTEPVVMSNGSAWIPGPIEMLRDQLLAAGIRADEIAEIHGGLDLNKRYMGEKGLTEKPPAYLNPNDKNQTMAMERFQRGEARVAIVTIASGGVGINLDDRAHGGVIRPRSVVFLNPDWTATNNIQATGRVWRFPTASYPDIVMLRAQNVPIERVQFNVLGHKYATLGAAVGGDMVRQLGPDEMKRYMQLIDAEGMERMAVDLDRIRSGEIRQVLEHKSDEIRDIALRPDGRNMIWRDKKDKTHFKVGLEPRVPGGKIDWVELSEISHSPDDAARIAIERGTDEHRPLRPDEVTLGARVWDTSGGGHETTIVKIAEGPGRTALLQRGADPSSTEVFTPSRYVMVQRNERENATVRFVDDLRSIETIPGEIAPAGQPPPDANAQVPNVQTPTGTPPAGPTPAQPAQPPPGAAPPGGPPGGTPPATPPAAGPPGGPTPPGGPVGPTATPPPGAGAPPAGAPPGAAPPGAPPGGGAAPPPGPPPAGAPPGAPGGPGGPPPPGGPAAGGPAAPAGPTKGPIERTTEMWDRVKQGPAKLPWRQRVHKWLDDADRNWGDRGMRVNRMTGEALTNVGAAALPPQHQAEIQWGLLGGRHDAGMWRTIERLMPAYQEMAREGLMKGDDPYYLNLYRKFQRDREVIIRKGKAGQRPTSADIDTVAEADKGLADLRTMLGPAKYGILERIDDTMVQEQWRQARQSMVGTLLSQEQNDALEEHHPHFNRTVFTKFVEATHMPPEGGAGARATQNDSTIRRLGAEGSNEDTEPPMQSFIRGLIEIEYAMIKNNAADSIIESSKHHPMLGPWLERSPSVVLKTGPESGGAHQPLATIVTWKVGDEKGSISRLVDGKRELWRMKKDAPQAVKDYWAELEAVAKNDDDLAAGLVADMLRKTNQPLRYGTTVMSIPFQLRNFFRDMFVTYVTHGIRPILDYPSAFWSRWSESPEFQELMREGGGFQSTVNRSPADIEEAIKQTGGILVRDMKDWRTLTRRSWEGMLGLRPIFEAIEAMPRIASYRELRRKGMSQQEAILKGYRRTTVDWNRMGLVSKQLNPAILFLNPRIQGTLNVGRVLRDYPHAKFRLGALMGAALTLWVWNHQQEGDKDVPDYIKNSHLYAVMPGSRQNPETGDYDGLAYVALPVGDYAPFIAPIHMMLNNFFTNDKTGAFDMLSQELQSFMPVPLPLVNEPTTVVGNLIPAPLRTELEIATNRRFFTNIPIVPPSLANLPKQEQYMPYTSGGSIWAANLAARLGHPFSPMELDFRFNENLGGTGQILLGIGTAVADKFGVRNPRADEVAPSIPIAGSILAGVYRTYGGQAQKDRYDLAKKLQDEAENAAVEAVKRQPGYEQASPSLQRTMLSAAVDELRRAAQGKAEIEPAIKETGLPPKYAGVKNAVTQRKIDEGVSAVTAYQRDPMNNPLPSREQLDFWAQYHGKIDPAYTYAVKQRSEQLDKVRGEVKQIINNAPPPATGSDAESMQRAAAVMEDLKNTPRYINVRTGQAVGTPEQWDKWDQWLSRYQSLPAHDPRAQFMPNKTKLKYRQQAQTLLAMQNQKRLRDSLADPDYQRYYGLGRGLSEETWQKLRTTPKYKDLPAGNDQVAAARDAFLASYRKLPPRDPRRLRYKLQALRYQRQLNPAYRQIVPTDRFLEQYGVADLGDIETPAA